jgi:hypothetical protein
VPPAAQRLRNDDSAGRNRLFGSAPRAAAGCSRPRWVADRPAAPRCGGWASECLWSRCRSGWCGRMALRGSMRRRRPCPLRFSPSYICLVGLDCGAEVPLAAQRLRDDRVWPAAAKIAEPQMPPAAQRLRDDDSAGRNRLFGSAPRAAAGCSRPRWVADRPAAPRCGGRASECLWLRCRSGWCGRMALRGSLHRRRPCPLRFSPSYTCLVGHDCGGGCATGGTTAPRSSRRIVWERSH